MPFVEGQDGWLVVGEAVVLAGDGEGLSCGPFVADGSADELWRLFLWFD